MFRHRGTFRRVQGAQEQLTECRFSVKDPSKISATAIADATAFAGTLSGDVSYRDIRLLSIHPDDKRPPKGSILVEQKNGQWVPRTWDRGTLEVAAWGQPSDFTGQAVGTCVLRR